MYGNPTSNSTARWQKPRPWQVIAVVVAIGGACAVVLGGHDRLWPADDRSCDKEGFLVPPYLQDPAADAMTILWFAPDASPGRVEVRPRSDASATPDATIDEPSRTAPWSPALDSRPQPTPALTSGAHREPEHCAEPPYRHRVRVTGLQPATVYEYRVSQGEARFRARFRTAPSADRPAPVRFIALADCETEPESTGKPARWGDPTGRFPNRRYPIDQTEGLRNNLAVIRDRRPDFVTISGDLVEAGGEQQDWDEFWSHFAALDGARSLAGAAPILAVPGGRRSN